MNTDTTIERLYDLKLGVMAEAFTEEAGRTASNSMSFPERFGMVVERQWAAREETRLQRRMKSARLKTSATIEEVDLRAARGLDREVFLDLAALAFIRGAGNVIITGATGLGKTYIACALADRALRRGHTALYKRLPRLLFELTLARADGSYLRTIDKLAKVELLILDDWGLAALGAQASSDLMEVIDDRATLRSTIVTSQLPVSEWHNTIADPSVADALLDRLTHHSVRIELKGGSMRKKAAKAIG